MDFEWDSRKAAANYRKHNVPFQEAATVFGDPLAITFEGQSPDHSAEGGLPSSICLYIVRAKRSSLGFLQRRRHKSR